VNGLDPATISGYLPSSRARFTDAAENVAAHLAQHGGYVSWSGGRDSTVVVDLARRANPDVPVVWFDSGLEFPDTHTYIHDFTERWSLNLHTIKATPDALTVMAQSGAWDHTREPDWSAPDLHDVLVTQPARKAREQFGHAEVWGLRAAESNVRRALLTPGQGCYRRADGTITYSPVWAWRDIDITAYLAHHNITENPVYQRLRDAGATGKDLRVGLALDGNNLQYGRVVWLRRCFPDTYARIEKALPRVREWS
jgi:phosphoadenosine phosphosulfate reductase